MQKPQHKIIYKEKVSSYIAKIQEVDSTFIGLFGAQEGHQRPKSPPFSAPLSLEC